MITYDALVATPPTTVPQINLAMVGCRILRKHRNLPANKMTLSRVSFITMRSTLLDGTRLEKLDPRFDRGIHMPEGECYEPYHHILSLLLHRSFLCLPSAVAKAAPAPPPNLRTALLSPPLLLGRRASLACSFQPPTWAAEQLRDLGGRLVLLDSLDRDLRLQAGWVALTRSGQAPSFSMPPTIYEKAILCPTFGVHYIPMSESGFLQETAC